MIIPSAMPAISPIAKSTTVFPLSFALGDLSDGSLSKPHATALASLATWHDHAREPDPAVEASDARNGLTVFGVAPRVAVSARRVALRSVADVDRRVDGSLRTVDHLDLERRPSVATPA
jgi:hypothetical protein